MKLSAMFLLAQTQPDYAILNEKLNIHNLEELKTSVSNPFFSSSMILEYRRNFFYQIVAPGSV
jgi:hypothetical protein